MASAMISRIINKSHNRINIKQTQNGGNNIIQSQSIHINQNMNITGDGNYVTGIHVGVDGDVIDDFNDGKISLIDDRDIAFCGGSTKKEKYLKKKMYHGILNSDPADYKTAKPLEDFLHFYETNAYKEGYLLERKIQGVIGDSENFRILPAFMSNKLSKLFPARHIYSESAKDPILCTKVDRAYNIYYRITDNAVFYIVSNDSRFNSFCPVSLEMCHLVGLRYFRKDDTSAPVFYDPKKDYLYTKDDNTIILNKVTETNFQKFLDLLWAMKFEIFIVILLIIIYINFH